MPWGILVEDGLANQWRPACLQKGVLRLRLTQVLDLKGLRQRCAATRCPELKKSRT